MNLLTPSEPNRLDRQQEKAIYELTLKKQRSKKSTVSQKQAAAMQQLASELVSQRKDFSEQLPYDSTGQLDRQHLHALEHHQNHHNKHQLCRCSESTLALAASAAGPASGGPNEFCLRAAYEQPNESHNAEPDARRANYSRATLVGGRNTRGPRATPSASELLQRQSSTSTIATNSTSGSSSSSSSSSASSCCSSCSHSSARSAASVSPSSSSASDLAQQTKRVALPIGTRQHAGKPGNETQHETNLNNQQKQPQQQQQQQQKRPLSPTAEAAIIARHKNPISGGSSFISTASTNFTSSTTSSSSLVSDEANIKLSQLRLEQLNNELERRLHQYEYLVAQEKAVLGAYKMNLFTSEGVNNFHLFSLDQRSQYYK